MQATPKIRILAIIAYAIALCAIQNWFVRTGLEPNQNSIWLYNGIASLLFGSRLLNPYFTPPADAATNAFAALTSVFAGAAVVIAGTLDAYVLVALGGLSSTILAGSLLVLIARPPVGAEQPFWVRMLDRVVRSLGSPNVLFTILIVGSVWLFHRSYPSEVFSILGAWAVVALLKPVEGILDYVRWAVDQIGPKFDVPIVGLIAGYQTPNIAVIRQSAGSPISLGETLLVPGEQDNWLLGIALNYVGRDEGNLLRVLTAPLPAQLAAFNTQRSVAPSSGAALPLLIPAEELAEIPALDWVNRLCGIVDSDTTFEFLRFEVIDEKNLSEGRLVEARIGEHRSVLFQLIEGVTHEEIVQNKNKYGYARAKARKIGFWNPQEGQFQHVSWLPKINAPVFLVDEQEFETNPRDIGHFPGTSYGVRLDLSQAVTHNTAVLGILGVGKTFLAVEMVERMMSADIKVVSLDLTNQYAAMLAEFVDRDYEARCKQALLDAAAGGQANRNRELGGSRNAFKAAVVDQLRDFMNPLNSRFLRVLNPAEFGVTKQAGGMFNNDAELSTLTPCEITAIFSDAALSVCQELGMTDQARLCLVYEEAHTLVPEWNSVAAEGDKQATAVSARAILQGRKFGLGCLLVTQRTANVTKTILNQCNTILAMRTFDDTGKDFLSNYIGADYAGVLPSLESRHAVVFGKASSCSNPVLVRLNDRENFVAAFRAAHPPRPLPEGELAEVEPVAGPADGPNDEVPF